jgi:hypothetical protein
MGMVITIWLITPIFCSSKSTTTHTLKKCPEQRLGQDLWHLKDKLQCFSHEEKKKRML